VPCPPTAARLTPAHHRSDTLVKCLALVVFDRFSRGIYPTFRLSFVWSLIACDLSKIDHGNIHTPDSRAHSLSTTDRRRTGRQVIHRDVCMIPHPFSSFPGYQNTVSSDSAVHLCAVNRNRIQSEAFPAPLPDQNVPKAQPERGKCKSRSGAVWYSM